MSRDGWSALPAHTISTLASEITAPSPSAKGLHIPQPGSSTGMGDEGGGCPGRRGQVCGPHSLFPPLQKDSLSQTYGLSRSSREAVSWRFRRPPMPYAWEKSQEGGAKKGRKGSVHHLGLKVKPQQLRSFLAAGLERLP